MHDAARMRGVEAVRDLHGVFHQFVDRNRTPADAPAERLAVEKFGHEVRLRLVRADVVDGDDVGMLEGGGGARFLREAAQPVGIARGPGRQDLDGDVALEARVTRPIHLAHAATADVGDDFVRAESGAERECHCRGTAIIPRIGGPVSATAWVFLWAACSP